MIQMQRVQPEIKKIQQKYKDDKTKQNEELLKFYQENKINPLAGCLPMIITIPIGIAVFRTFSRGVQHHLPADRHGSASSTTTSAGTCARRRAAQAAAPASRTGTPRRRCTSSAMSLNLTAHARDGRPASPHAIPYYFLIALVALTGLVPGAPDPGAAAAERQHSAPTRRCRR